MVWWLLVAAVRGEVVDRVVAVVEDSPVLRSEVAVGADLARLDPNAKYPPPDGGDVTAWAVDLATIRTLAGRVALYDPPDDEVRGRIDVLRDAFGDRQSWAAFLTRHGLDDGERLATYVRHQLVVERFLLRNLRVSPSDPGWAEAVEALLAQLRPRVRVRLVPTGSP